MCSVALLTEDRALLIEYRAFMTQHIIAGHFWQNTFSLRVLGTGVDFWQNKLGIFDRTHGGIFDGTHSCFWQNTFSLGVFVTCVYSWQIICVYSCQIFLTEHILAREAPHIHSYTSMRIHIHSYTLIYIHTHLYTFIYIHVHSYIFMYIHTHS